MINLQNQALLALGAPLAGSGGGVGLTGQLVSSQSGVKLCILCLPPYRCVGQSISPTER